IYRKYCVGDIVKKFLFALVVLLSLSACAQVQNAGAAAIVEGKEISVSTIGQQYTEVISNLDGGLKPGTDKEIHKSLVSAFVLDELVTLAATELGVAATDADIQVTRRNYQSMFGGKKAFIKTAAENAIPVSGIDSNIRTTINFENIGKSLDPEGNPDSQSAAAVDFLLEYGKLVDIEVNPRFGTFALEKFGLVNVQSDSTITGKQLKLALMPK
ncbi:MAG: hypothetical protein RLZZ508_609, partial [Actinomycetota bacterium]